jgi:hypothetical protein
VWSEDDNGDVPPRYTIAKGYLYMPRGLTLDPKKTVIVAELYDRPPAPRETARAAR